MRTAFFLSIVSLGLLTCDDSPSESRPIKPGSEQIAGMLEQVIDVRLRVIPALTDRAAAQGIGAELQIIEIAAGRNDFADLASTALERAERLFDLYGTANGAAATDAPDLAVIRFALDKTLEAIQASSVQ